MTSHRPLQPTLLLLALAAAYPLAAVAAPSAGTAQFATGDVSLRRVDGKSDALTKGKDIESGQSIVTGPSGRAQVRFTDGGLVSLQPNTEFKIANYVDQADPKQDRFVVDLLRGGMRALTGLIGKRNRDNYQVTTTTATIGIRGSGFAASYNPDGSLNVTAELDAIEVCNVGGCTMLIAGESVIVRSTTTAPSRTNIRTNTSTPPPPTERPDVAGNQVNNSGTSSLLATSSGNQVFNDLAVAIAYGTSGGINQKGRLALVGGSYDYPLNTNTYVPEGERSVLSSLTDGALTGFTVTDTYTYDDSEEYARLRQQVTNIYVTEFRNGTSGTTKGGQLGKTTDADFIGWGSWVSGTRSDSSNGNPASVSTIDSLHYVIGRPTPEAQMPAYGQQATYQFAGGTAVSSISGAGTLNGGSLVANFYGGGSAYASMTLDTSFSATPITSNLYFNQSRVSCSDGAQVAGFFTGANASRAGFTYSANNPGGSGIISGTAIFGNPTFTNNAGRP